MKAGSYLFVQYGYGEDLAPHLAVLPENSTSFEYFAPLGQVFTLHFDTAQRFCTGWHDLATGTSYPCPDTAGAHPKYNQCPHCQRKTGFNPAFYHANSVSPQQQARNRLPHSLYLAHFAPGVIKVGITWKGRGIRRLLDQGARTAIIVKTFPSAEVARQYEAKAAKLNNIAETIQTASKLKMLARPYDADAAKAELQAAVEHLQKEIGISPDSEEPMHLDNYYLNEPLQLPFTNLDTQKSISGRCIGMLGSTIITEQDNDHYLLPLGKLTGYRLTFSEQTAPNNVGPKQITLF